MKQSYRGIVVRPAQALLAVFAVIFGIGLLSAGAAFGAWVATDGAAPAQTRAASLSAPVDTTATATSGTSITVGWTLPAAQLVGAQYVVTRTNGPDSPVVVCTVESSVASCADTGLVALTDYTYTVVASLGANWHSAAGTASASTVPTFSLALEAGPYVAGAPVTVTSLTAVFGGSTDIGYSGTKTINWTGLGDGPSGQSPSYPSSSVTFVDGVATPGSFTTFSAGPTTLGATDASFSSATGSAPLTLNPGAATKMAVTTQPTSAVDGVAFTTQPVVTIQDANGNTVTDSNASVTLAVASGSGTLACTSNPVQAAIGVATFDGCALTGTLGDYTLTASATDLTDADTSNIALAIGVAAQVVVNTMVDSTDGATLATQPVATIEDIGGNTVTSATDAVTLHASSGTLSCDQNPVDAVAGVATFAGCSLTGQTGAHTLSASVEGLPAGDSNSFVLMTGPATQLAVTTQPDGAANGAAFTTQPVITIEDVGGNTVTDSSASVTLASSAGSLACTDNPVIASNGIASFDGCSLTGIIGEYTLTASATDLTSATTDSFVLAHGAAAKLAVSVQPNGAANAAAFTTQPVVTVQDVSGNTITDSSASVSLAVDSGSGTMACTDISVTATNGIASFDGCAITGTIGNYTLTATSGSLTSATTDSFTLGFGAASHLAVTTQPGGAANAAAFTTQPAITVLDSASNTVTDSSDSVTLALATGSGTLACTNTSVNATNGVATFAGCKITGTIGDYTLTASAFDLTSATTDSFTLGFGAASHLAVTTQPGGAANAAAFTTQPAITVLDSAGNTVTDSSANVSLAVATGSGTLACTDISVTATNGIATFAGCKITGTVGSYTLTATSGSLASATTDSFTLGFGAATKLAVTTQPNGAANGAAFTTQPVVTVQDASGNTVTDSSANVTLAVVSGDGTMACTDGSVIATNGIATFDGCAITGTIGNYTLTASAADLTSATTDSFILGFGAATHLAVTTQPSGAANAAAFTTQPVITVLDSSGNVVTDSSDSVTLASSAGTFACTSNPVNATNGIATFAGCKITGTVGDYTLLATASSLNGATTDSFSLGFGAATHLAVTTQPNGAANGVALTTQPVITVLDSAGNTVTDSSANVTLAVATGSGTLACTDASVTPTNGIATFAGCKITGTVGSYTLTATSGSLASATTDSFTLGFGAATKLAVTTQPSGAANGVALTTQPVVTVQDASGNTVTDSSASVTLAVDSGDGTLACTDGSVTATNGIATFAGCAITGTIGNYTLTASATDLTSATTSSFNLTYGAAAKLAVTTQPSGAVNGVAFTTQPVITVLDSSGNVVTDLSDSVTLASSAGTLACTGNPVNATNGIATFAGCKITGTIGNYTLLATSGSLTSATTNSFTLTFGSANRLNVTTQPAGAANGVAFTTQPVVTIEDASGNTVTGSSASVTLAVATGSGSLACTDISVTATNGIATFAGCKITGTVGSYTLTATSGSLASATTDSFTLAHGSATKMAFTTQPGGAANGVAFTTQPVVTVQDASGNTVTGSSASVSLASSAGTLACTGNPVNATNGVATFRGCSLTGIIGLYTLTATSGGLTGATTNSITLTYGAAAKLMVTVQPSGAVNGEAFTTQPVVTVLDSANNIVTDSNAQVTLAVASGTGSMDCTNTGGLTATASNGIATFIGCSLSGTVGNFTLVASSGSLTSATTSSFSLTAAAPGTPGISAAVSSGSSPIWVDRETVTLTDSLDNAGVASVAYYSCPASAGSCTSNTPWSLIGSSSTGPDWSVSWTSLPADGTYRVVAVATGANATVSAPSSAVQIGIDSNGPTVAAPSVAAAHTSGSSPLTVSNEDLTLTDTSVSDTGSGVKSVSYYYCAGASGACSATLIGTSTTASGNYSVTWAAPLPADGAYRIQAVASDNVTNSTTSSSTPINVDSGAPTVSKPIVNGFQ